MCDPDELKASLKTCVDACFNHEDTAAVFNCADKCRAKNAETVAKCDNRKGEKS